MSDWTERDRARQQQRRVVVWGCAIHKTPAGQQCQGCADLSETLHLGPHPRRTEEHPMTIYDVISSSMGGVRDVVRTQSS